MSRIFPYPVMTLGLFVMWIALAGATPGHTVLAFIVSTGSALTLKALGEKSTRVKRVDAIVTLASVVFVDILRSNYDVARLILFGKRLDRKSGFMTVPIRLKNPSSLAVLSIVLTSTPGTAWLDYNAAQGTLIIHVFDLKDESHWLDLISNRYERLLLEIFE
ncbi:Na+/H+ antiporter subunit E [Georhizobium profundi]|uniref:Na+/H+ antiporter subunit E n=1 Tax=Georhizobium profundi TaxID=2341112 RepID=A0A3Q8XQL7_9HYPH|nr:Na+/H+ antiporter subunit E [Georhizobium profundi]AZN71579.1 Na+/H+ antiporter subunit E [Georhizobium profundi]